MSSNAEATPAKSSASSRMPMPSLNQLAARMSTASTTTTTNNSTPSSTAPSNISSRPRLAASILRTTTSNVSLNSAASSNDSVAVNPANSTRAASPTSTSMSTPLASRPSTPATSTDMDVGGEPLTADRLDKLNSRMLSPGSDGLSSSSTSAPSPYTADGDGHQQSSSKKDKGKPAVKGYKNIPSLDAITARLAKTRTLSVDGTPKPPEPEMIEDPKTPGVQVVKEELPLRYSWTIYHDSKAKYPYTPAPTSAALPPSSNSPTDATQNVPPNSTATFTHAPDDYEANLTVIGTFTTVEQFCRYFNWLKPPSHLERNSNYHLFKSPIKPMWEDPANAQGGKWVLTMRNNPELLDRSWAWLCMALVGEELEDGFGDEVCGAVVSLRAKVDRIQLWVRRRDDVQRVNAIGKKLVSLLDVGEKDGVGLEFQFNTDEKGVGGRFLSIQPGPVTASAYRGTFGALPGSAGVGASAGAGGEGGHAHSRSIGGIGVGGSGGFSPVVDQSAPPPMSAGSSIGGSLSSNSMG
ncbi:translation initiation factor eIF 4e-like domain-containing protein [Lentinula raphanica]|nr:translation initiation factor eIF 4e-like domain-containing protein [Lentinula raphanica]KAJ3974346.1 translation initiation factor eIF 4e-like domain-containing protein [Lentinula raphanica]